MNKFLRLSSVFCLLLTSSCTTRNIDNNLNTIRIPSELSSQDAKIAILVAVKPLGEAQEIKTYEEMTDNALRAAFGWSYQKISRRGIWFVEDVDPNSVLVAYDNGKHYFRVEYIIGDSEITPRIDGSRNLNQSYGRMHKRTFQWLSQMESKIRRSMGMVAAIKAE